MSTHTAQQEEKQTPAEHLMSLIPVKTALLRMPISQDTVLQMYTLKGEYLLNGHLSNADDLGKRIKHYEDVLAGRK
jgi:hypothetical protein